MHPNQSQPDHPLARLAREDLDFVTELVLCSGSLKELAERYGVSYPTIRSRLDRLIERLRSAINGRTPDPVAELLAQLIERGELAPSSARHILETVRASAPDANAQRPSAHVNGDRA